MSDYDDYELELVREKQERNRKHWSCSDGMCGGCPRCLGNRYWDMVREDEEDE